jgi:hypothetical protein
MFHVNKLLLECSSQSIKKAAAFEKRKEATIIFLTAVTSIPSKETQIQ